MEFSEIVDFLRNYDGKPIRLMEVCGSHTHAIATHGIRDILSDKIQLLSGPGCPVCVTPTAYMLRTQYYSRHIWRFASCARLKRKLE